MQLDSPPVPPANVGLLEPVFVNPNSHEAVRVLLREIGTSAGVKQCVGEQGCREWLTIVCDGLPYSLMRTTIAQSRDEARKAAYHVAGILDVGSMSKESLVGYCRQHSLNVSGSLASLRSRVSTHVQGRVASGGLNVLGSIPAGEFDWVVSQSGGLHWEMNLI